MGYATGMTDIEIHFLQIKFTAIGVYLDPEIVGHLHKWKGKSGKELGEDDDFFDALISGISRFKGHVTGHVWILFYFCRTKLYFFLDLLWQLQWRSF